jgi:hypothetical protein
MAEETWVILKADIEDIKNKLDLIAGKSTLTGNTMAINWASVAMKIGTALGIAFSTRAIINFGKQAETVFEESTLSALRLTTVLKNVGVSPEGIASIHSAIENLSKLSLYKTDELNSVLNDLVRRFGNVGVAIKALPVIIEGSKAGIGDLTTTANELVLGIQNALAGIQSGGRGLKDFGITVTKGKSALDLLDEALSKVSGSATEVNKTIGGTLALKLAYHDLQETVGSKLSPAMQGFSSGLATQIGLMIGASVTSKEYKETLSNAFEGIGNRVGLVTRGLINDMTILISGLGVVYDFISLQWDKMEGDAKTFKEAIGNVGKAWEGNLDPIEKTKSGADDVSTKMKEWEDEVTKFVQGLGLIPTNIDNATNSADKFKAAWASIKIEGMNVPELTKFVGNLNMAVAIPKIPIVKPPPLNVKVSVEIHGNLSLKEQMVRGGREIGNAIISGIKEPIEDYVSHATGPIVPAYGGR